MWIMGRRGVSQNAGVLVVLMLKHINSSMIPSAKHGFICHLLPIFSLHWFPIFLYCPIKTGLYLFWFYDLGYPLWSYLWSIYTSKCVPSIFLSAYIKLIKLKHSGQNILYYTNQKHCPHYTGVLVIHTKQPALSWWLLMSRGPFY